MTDPYANIRRALDAIQAAARGHRHKRDLAHLDFREACDPDTIRALLKERDALERDARRYRWLRAKWGRIAETYEDDRLIFIGDEKYGEGWDTNAESLDAAIDQAAANGGGDG